MACMVYQFESRPLKSIEKGDSELGKHDFFRVPAFSVSNRIFFWGFLGLSDFIKDHHFGWNMVGDSQSISSKIDYDELAD